MSKKCCRCKEDKNLSEFYNNKNSKDGKCKRCIECNKEANLIHRLKKGQTKIHKQFTRKVGGFETWIEELKIIHNNKYDYSKTLNVHKAVKNIIICPIHGEFEQSISNHYQHGCNKCTGRGLSTNEKIIELIKVHWDKYDYSLIEEITTEKYASITYICERHGLITQTYRHHKSGRGCRFCGKCIDYTLKNIIDKPELFKNKSAELYLLRLTSEEEVFFKVGITTNKERRYKEIGKVYDVEELYIEVTNLYKAIQLEHNIKREFEHLKYQPKKIFNGHTECFTQNPINSMLGYYYEQQEKEVEAYLEYKGMS